MKHSEGTYKIFDIFQQKGVFYGDYLPYRLHLELCLATYERYSFYIDIKSRMVIANAVLCHDLMEDCGYTFNSLVNLLRTNFNLPVEPALAMADLVYAVTDELGKNRKERIAKTWLKILAAGPEAIFVKLCDRIANTGFSRLNRPSEKYDMYRDEYPAFRAIFYPVTEHFEGMWDELDQLSGFNV